MKQLLPQRWPLLDVDDVEATCRTILDRALRSRNVHYLAPDLYEDALTFFIEEAWTLSRQYDPEKVRNPDGSIGQSFNTYLHKWLGLRLADWYRKTNVDIRYVEAPTFVGQEYADLAPERHGGQSWRESAGSVDEIVDRGVLVATAQTFSLGQPGGARFDNDDWSHDAQHVGPPKYTEMFDYAAEYQE